MLLPGTAAGNKLPVHELTHIILLLQRDLPEKTPL